MSSFNRRLNFFAIAFVTSLTIFSKGNMDTTDGRAGIFFRENKGQVSDQFSKPRPDVLFSGSDGNLVYHLTQSGVSYQLNELHFKPSKSVFGKIQPQGFNGKSTVEEEKRTIYRIDVKWLNSNRLPEVIPNYMDEGYENFYSESCPFGALNVKSYKEIFYKQIYAGIDLKWYENKGHLKCDYLISQGADYQQIKLSFAGALFLSVGNSGELIIATPLGNIVEEAPIVVQGERTLSSKWVVNGLVAGFRIENIDASKPYVIDPVVRLWGTYYGGSGLEDTGSACTDQNNRVIITGRTQSMGATNLATTGSHQTTYGGPGTGIIPGDAYLAVFDQMGVRQWATYYGGNGSDYAIDCKADILGNIYMAGATTTSNSVVIATSGCHQPFLASASASNREDAFLVKFDATGTRLWGTYYGDVDDDWINTLSVDQNNNVIVGGGTWQNSAVNTMTVLASAGAHQTTHSQANGDMDAFAAKFSPNGIRLWSTYFGALGYDNARASAVDSQGNIYIGGTTTSTNAAIITTNGCHQSIYGGGNSAGLGDAYLVKFDQNGSRLWSTFYGGNGLDVIVCCFIDATDNVYISGGSTSSNATAIATPGSYQANYAGGSGDTFLAKLTPGGQRIWGTYYGGPGYDDWGMCCRDNSGNIYLAGLTQTTGGTDVAMACAYQSVFGGGTSDCFVVKFDVLGNRAWSTYYGGPGDEYPQAICSGGLNSLFLFGRTDLAAPAFASSGAHQTVFGGTEDMFLAKFGSCTPVTPLDLTPNHTVCAKPSPTLLSSACTSWFSSATGTIAITSGNVFNPANLVGDTTFYMEDMSCGYASGTRTAVHLFISPTPTIIASASPPEICLGNFAILTGSGATTYTWNTGTSIHITSVTVTPTVSSTYTVTGTSVNGCTNTAIVSVGLSTCLGLSEDPKNIDNLLVFPNPNNGEFNLMSTSPMEIRLVSELGQVVRTISLSIRNGNTDKITQLDEGVYFIVDSSLRNRQKVIIIK